MTSGPQLPLARELAALLERALNREIAESTPAKDLVADLDGESFAIDVRGLGVSCVLHAKDGRVTVEPRWQADAQSRSRDLVSTGMCEQSPRDGLPACLGNDSARPPATAAARPPTATLSATPIDLLRLARSADLSTLRGTLAEIKGSPEVAERFAKLLKLARPDLEEYASRWLGDVPAHALGEAARAAGAWLERAANALRANTAEFLQEESRALPATLEVQAFYSDVERLRDGVERAAARLARLERR
jgi:ubiquinone biosynthesis protein UbiJ